MLRLISIVRPLGAMVTWLIAAVACIAYLTSAYAGPEQGPGPVDYIVIAHEDLDGTALDSLLSFKVNQGFSYERFIISDGVWTDSILSIIQTRYNSSDYAPLYVLLIGTAKSDPGWDSCQCDKYASAAAFNFIPTPYRFDLFGTRTGYDQWYTWLEPWHYVTHTQDIIIGRIPARADFELQRYVNKLIEYVSDTSDAQWKHDVLLVAGDKDRGPYPDYPSPIAVNNSINQFALSLPTGMSSSIIRYSHNANPIHRQFAFRGAIDSGKVLVATLTTGSSFKQMGWIIERPEFNARIHLHNSGMYPVMLSASCNLAQFDLDLADGGESLAENLLLAPSQGVIAIIAPTGFSSDISNFAFTHKFRENLFDRAITGIGNLTATTCLELKKSHYGPSDTYDMMTVLGDPGLKIDLGSALSPPQLFSATMELTDPFPYQERPYWVDDGLQYTRAGIVKNRAVFGSRAFSIFGDDKATGDPTGYWTLYDDLGITLDSSSRFLTYYVKPVAHCEGVGRFGVNLHIQGEGLIDACQPCGLVFDQYSTLISPIYRSAPIGEKSFYAFDLKNAYGYTVDEIVVGYDALTPSSTGEFKAYFDEIKLTSSWGIPPEAGPIEMPANVYVNSVTDVSVSAYDSDILSYGDDLAVEWSATHGFIVGSGFDVEYHAPSYEAWDVDIKAKVFDKGGHVDSSMKNIGVFDYGGGGGCPHLFIETSGRYADQGAVLTRSSIQPERAQVQDAIPFFVKPDAQDGYLRFSLKEMGQDVTTIDRVSLSLAHMGDREGRSGITQDGRIVNAIDPIPPSLCHDDQSFDQLDRVRAMDGNAFRAFGPGYLIVSYRNLFTPGLSKISQTMADEGGSGIPPPPKDLYKIAIQGGYNPPPDVPNYISISVYQPQTRIQDSPDHDGWTEVERIAAQTTPRLTQFVDLLPYVDSTGHLLLKIDWTWSFYADDLSFYRFSQADVKEITSALTDASHSWLGTSRSVLSEDDGDDLTLEPNEEITLTFELPKDFDYDVGVMKFWGKYEPFTGTLRSPTSTSETVSTADLLQNSPNPFNAGTTIRFNLPRSGQANLAIFNILGQRVVTLENGPLDPGVHTCDWDGRDQSGQVVATGVYFYVLRFEGQNVSRKMVLLR